MLGWMGSNREMIAARSYQHNIRSGAIRTFARPDLLRHLPEAVS